MAGLTLLTAGDRSRLGEESRDDGLDDSEWGDMGLASGEAPWWSEDREERVLPYSFLKRDLIGRRNVTLAFSPPTH